MRKPGDDKPVETLLETLKDKGYRTGLVSTTHLTHATPAAFASHVPSRNKYEDIGRQMITCGKVDVMLGGGGKGMNPDLATEKSYKVVTDRAGLADAVADRDARVVGLFGRGHMPYEYEYMMRIDNGYDTLPHLSEMTRAAIALLQGRGNGFFLMVESGRIDHAGHVNDLRANVMETLEFDSAVRDVLAWAKDRDDTLVIVTADHETGGLSVTKPRGRGNWPEATWDSKHHSGVAVPVYAWGMGGKLFEGKLDNTDIRKRITRALAGEGQDPSADRPKKTKDKAYTP
jgi:alkaline phosphatase